MDLDNLLNRGTKQANVKEEMRELVISTLRAADMLFLDEYTAADMNRSGIGVELTDREASHIARDPYHLNTRRSPKALKKTRWFRVKTIVLIWQQWIIMIQFRVVSKGFT